MVCCLLITTEFWVQYPGRAAAQVEFGQFVDVMVAMEFFPQHLEGVKAWAVVQS